MIVLAQYGVELLAGLGALLALVVLWLIVLVNRKNQQIVALESSSELHQRNLEQAVSYCTQLSDEKAQLAEQMAALNETHQISQTQLARAQAQLEAVPTLEAALAAKQAELSNLQTEHTQLKVELAEANTRMARDAEHHHQQMALLNDNKEALKTEFSHLANEIFEQKSQRFNEQSSQSMNALLGPFQKQIDQFRQRVDDIHTQDAEGRGQLLNQLKSLSTMNDQLNQQASELTKALKGDKKLQGNWGELQVERILEQSGLRRGREYEREVSMKDDTGKHWRPDFVIQLPEGKHIVIDSKVSLNAYQAAVSAKDDELRAKALKAHVDATRQHIRTLSDKNYSQLKGLNAPDFVLMFMPIESAFVAAFEADNQLFNDAFERHIVVVTPTTLLATLRTVANVWVLERQNENAKALFGLAGKIYDKVRVFGEKMERLGTQIQSADKSYQEAMNTLTEGRGSMVSYVKRLRDLGAPASKPMTAAFEEAESAPDQDRLDADSGQSL